MGNFDRLTPQAEIARIASSAIRGEIRLVEAARRITNLSHRLEYAPDEDILFFIGFDSETEGYPLGDQRALVDPEVLAKLDKHYFEYEKRCMDQALLACKRLLKQLEP